MKSARISGLFLFVLLALPSLVFGILRFPPPQFKSGYELPVTTKPESPAVFDQALDVTILLVTLSLCSYLALKKRSRRGILLVGIFSLLYLGFWRRGWLCPFSSIENVALALSGHSYAIPIAIAIFFALPLIFAILFGRVFCASVCPHGVIQDVVLLRPIKVPWWLEHGLRMFAYVYLGLTVLFAATGSVFIIYQYDPFVVFFRRGGNLNMLILGVSFLLVSMFIGRPYCRYFCPYSVILGWMSKYSKWHVTITPDKCIQCRLCEDSCPFGAIRKPTQETRSRSEGKKRLAILLALLPVLIGSGILIGVRIGTPLSRLNWTVKLAQRVWLEDTGKIEGSTEISDAFRGTGRPTAELYEEALSVNRQFTIGGGLLGAFLGLVIGIKMIQLSVRRSRVDYEIDQSNCVFCGRCISYCPIGRAQNEEVKAGKPESENASLEQVSEKGLKSPL